MVAARCQNLNHGRRDPPIRGCPMCGAVVNAKLTGGLAARLKEIGVPPSFQSLVLHAVQTGGATSGAASGAEHSKNATVAKIATKVVHAAYEAFGSGLHLALAISGALILLGAVVAAFAIRPSPDAGIEL